MVWRIEFDAGAKKELAKLDRQVARRITRFLRERLAVLDDPLSIGLAMKGQKFGEFWRYRVGDYRILATIEDATICIIVIRIGNRNEIYRPGRSAG